MDRTNFVDGPILPASWLNRLQDKAEGALEDQSKALLAGEIVAGLGLTIAGTTGTIAAGLAYDDQGRPIPAPQALTVALDDVGRPAGAEWLWAAVWVRAAVHRSGSVHDLDNVAHDLYLDDGAEAGIDVGAGAATRQAAVRPVLAAGKVLIADVAVDAATAWADLAIDTSRRTALSRDAGAIDRAVAALETALAALQAAVERIKTSIPGRPDLSGLATTVQLNALTVIVNAAKATAEAAVTQAQLAAATPDATTAARGLVELATDAEVLTGTDPERAVTPRGLAGRTATETRAGIVRLASKSEVQETAAPAGTDFSRAVSVGRLRKDLTATAARRGLVELATDTEAEAGADTERAVTPAGVRAHGDKRYRDVVLSSAPLLGVVNLSEPVAGFRWIRALTADGAAKDFPAPLGNAWKPGSVAFFLAASNLNAVNLTPPYARTVILRDTALAPARTGGGLARIGAMLYSADSTKLRVVNLNDPALAVTERMTWPAAIGTGIGLTSVGGTLYMVARQNGAYRLWSINPSTSTMTEIGAITWAVNPGLSRSAGRALGLAAIGNVVYLSDPYTDRLLTIDVTNARTTAGLPNALDVGSTRTAGDHGMFTVGRTLYISADHHTVATHIVDTATGRATRHVGRGLAFLYYSLATGHIPEPGSKLFADGPRSVVCRVPGATHIIGVR